MRRLVFFAGCFLLALAGPALADPQDVASDISREMVSPYCPGVTLHDCPSDSSHELRRQIAGWAESGMTEDEIWQRLEAEFGSDIRATPSTSGSGLWAWLLPIAAGLAGVALLVLLATKWSRKGAAESAAVDPDVTPEQRRRLDVELAALRDQQG